MVRHLLFLTATFMFGGAAIAQKKNHDIITQADCRVDYMLRSADSMLVKYQKDGFVRMMATPVSNENAYDMPVLFPLQQGVHYHFIYIGDKASKTYEMRLTDKMDHVAVKQRKMWGDVDGNIIEFSYKPQSSDGYVANLFQYNPKLKQEKICGYFMVLKRTSGPVESTASASRPAPKATAPVQKGDFFDGYLPKKP